VICLALMSYGYLNGNAFGTLVGATALIPYVVYFLTVLAYGARRHRLDRLPGAFHLGQWAMPVFVLAVIWLLTALAALILPSAFRDAVGSRSADSCWPASGTWSGYAAGCGTAPPGHPGCRTLPIPLATPLATPLQHRYDGHNHERHRGECVSRANNGQWRNWAGNQSATPSRVVAPASVAELAEWWRGGPGRRAGQADRLRALLHRHRLTTACS